MDFPEGAVAHDRRFDWLLSADIPSDIVITPEAVSEENIAFRFELTGRSLILRFRPHYYRHYKGLEYFEPWNYPIKEESVAGWCSWFAFFSRVTEEDIHHTADMFSEILVPFGLEYLQIDDGYQQNPIGEPERWLIANEKFPSGMESLAKYIKEKGMKPGIWTNVSFANTSKSTHCGICGMKDITVMQVFIRKRALTGRKYSGMWSGRSGKPSAGSIT